MPRSALSRVAACFFLFAAAQTASAQTTFTESVLYSFPGSPDGASPMGMIQAQDGNFYGLAAGGAHGYGIIYKVTPAGAGSIFYTFTGKPDADVSSLGTLIQGSDGNFYGTSFGGGAGNYGSVFEVTTAGVYTTLYSFTDQADGEKPTGLVQGSDGNFYGTTSTGNESGEPGTPGYSYEGTVYEFSAAGQYILLLDLDNADGFFPFGSLVEATAGIFLGTADDGGNFNEGTMFSINGTSLDPVYSFSNAAGSATAPSSGLTGGPGNLYYGGTPHGGTHGDGELYSISASGSYTALTPIPFDANGSSGVDTQLLAASDGNLYGNYVESNGVLFQLTPSGTLTSIYSFGVAPDASIPQGALIQGADGNLYGAADMGGTNSAGAIFKLAPSTAFTVPVKLTLSSSTTIAGQPVTLSWSTQNAFSVTASQCFAFVQGGVTGAGSWSGQKSASGSATITPATAGTYTYALTCGGVESGFATLTVSASTKSTSTTGLSASPNPATVGESVTLSATVSGPGSTPTGSVTFYYGSHVLSTVPLKSGTATLTASTSTLTPGVYQLTAGYSGNSSYNSSTSAAYTVTLKKATTSTKLSASPDPVTPPAVCTLTATVKRSAGSGFATGTVTFSVGGTTVGSAKLNASGVATLSAPTGTIAAGSYPVIATYGGDAEDGGSASGAVTVVVQ